MEKTTQTDGWQFRLESKTATNYHFVHDPTERASMIGRRRQILRIGTRAGIDLIAMPGPVIKGEVQ